jgi:hypothetical protein
LSGDMKNTTWVRTNQALPENDFPVMVVYVDTPIPKYLYAFGTYHGDTGEWKAYKCDLPKELENVAYWAEFEPVL